MFHKPIKNLQQILQQQASPQTKVWFENYLKGSITYYELKTPEVKNIVAQWHRTQRLGDWTVAQQLELCQQLMLLEHAEEKFAAILYVQNYLLKHASSNSILMFAQWCYDKDCFFDWSTADWFTVRVLANLIKLDDSSVMKIARWCHSRSLWQRRASVVALRAVVKQAQYHDLIAQTVAALVTDRQRFIQTGIGWILSDLSKVAMHKAEALFEKHFKQLSREVVERHSKYLPKHLEYKRLKRQQ